MQVGQKFSIAIHILLSVEFFKDEKNTSEFLSQTIGTNPVIVRQIITLLKTANLVQTRAGVGGVSLAKDPSEISLLDVFNAVNERENLFKIHENSPAACPLGGQISSLLLPHFQNAQESFKQSLAGINLQNLLNELR